MAIVSSIVHSFDEEEGPIYRTTHVKDLKRTVEDSPTRRAVFKRALTAPIREVSDDAHLTSGEIGKGVEPLCQVES